MSLFVFVIKLHLIKFVNFVTHIHITRDKDKILHTQNNSDKIIQRQNT